jgi:spore germination protein KC
MNFSHISCKFAQQNNIDFTDMTTIFEAKHPMLWKQYKDKWQENFPSLPINVQVQSKINRTYDIKNSIVISEEEHK